MFIIYAVYCLGSENTIENKIVGISPLSDLNNFKCYDKEVPGAMGAYSGRH